MAGARVLTSYGEIGPGPSYGDRVTHERLSAYGQDWMLIRPYFEHPPLMHVFASEANEYGLSTLRCAFVEDTGPAECAA